MRDVAAIVEPAIDFDQNTRSILKEHIALQDDERNADAHERKSVSFREAAARRRVEIGRMLVEQKRSGKIKHGGWLPYLEKLGISSQDASEWMRTAGFVESSNSGQTENVRNLDAPSRRDVGIDKRPRKSDEPDKRTLDSMRFMAGTIENARKRDADIETQPDPPAAIVSESSIGDDARAVESSLLTMVSNALGTVARKWPGDLRRLADELRRFADKLERRSKE